VVERRVTRRRDCHRLTPHRDTGCLLPRTWAHDLTQRH
jgi:hypothetical protein